MYLGLVATAYVIRMGFVLLSFTSPFLISVMMESNKIHIIHGVSDL
jgi:hypothetical protein